MTPYREPLVIVPKRPKPPVQLEDTIRAARCIMGGLNRDPTLAEAAVKDAIEADRPTELTLALVSFALHYIRQLESDDRLRAELSRIIHEEFD